MAWWVLYRKVFVYKKNGYYNAIQGYKEYLYEKWWESLSHEEQQKLKEKEASRKRNALQSLCIMHAVVGHFNSGFDW